MTRDFDIFFGQSLDCAQLDSVFELQPGFERPPATMTHRAWHFYPEDPRLPGCAWIYKPTNGTLAPGAMESMSLQRIEELLGNPPVVSVNVECSSDDPHGKNALHVAVLLGAAFPNLVVFAWDEQGTGEDGAELDHFHTLADCRALAERGRGFPWTWFGDDD